LRLSKTESHGFYKALYLYKNLLETTLGTVVEL
jgi:hypothetical protein